MSDSRQQRRAARARAARSTASPAAATPAVAQRRPLGLTMSYIRAFIFFILAAAVILFLISRMGGGGTDAPSDTSAVAGFTRDMKTHHAQAVEMALIVRDRTNDPALRSFLTDMILTQQNQIGQFEGWLNIWGLPQGSAEKPMAWMGHPVDGLMPGMATKEQIEALKTMPEKEMIVSFLNLMIAHHRSAVDMSNAIIEKTDNQVVVRLAKSIISSQNAEISLMNEFLAQYGAAPNNGAAATPGATPGAMPGMDMSH